MIMVSDCEKNNGTRGFPSASKYGLRCPFRLVSLTHRDQFRDPAGRCSIIPPPFRHRASDPYRRRSSLIVARCFQKVRTLRNIARVGLNLLSEQISGPHLMDVLTVNGEV
uniref:Uncharacterized protein n=1 Tax=Anopheles maculatus TaxID=74869 RepID=A0A182SLM5_9DIPT